MFSYKLVICRRGLFCTPSYILTCLSAFVLAIWLQSCPAGAGRNERRASDCKLASQERIARQNRRRARLQRGNEGMGEHTSCSRCRTNDCRLCQHMSDRNVPIAAYCKEDLLVSRRACSPQALMRHVVTCKIGPRSARPTNFPPGKPHLLASHTPASFLRHE
jgi:hypothetical protein